MKRYHDEKHIALRNWKDHIMSAHGDYNITRGKIPPGLDCKCDVQIGRFRKMDGIDCGKTRCYTCHSLKLCGDKTQQEKIFDLKFSEGLNEYLENKVAA